MITNKEEETKYYELSDKLRKMRLSGMADGLEALLKDENLGLRDPLQVLSSVIDQEWDLRYEKKFKKCLKNATLKFPGASLDERLYEADRKIDVRAVEQLSTCAWIDEGKNLTFTGMTGTGKTYLLCALAVCAIRKFYTVKYIKASSLINEATAAALEGKIIEYENRMISYDLLIIDDFGFMSLGNSECLRIFEILDGRSARKSTAVASQLPRESWYDLFQDNTYADACMDRLTKGAYKIELFGPSLR